MWSLRLSEAQHAALVALLSEQDELHHELASALEELQFARWDELPDAELPWERVEQLAARQGISEADVVWDLCGGLGGLVESSAVSARRRSRPRAAAPRRR